MQTGLLFRWGKPIVGREEESFELFSEVMTYFESKKTEGAVTYFEPFLFSTADADVEAGFLVVKGPVTKIFEMIEEEAYKRILAKALLLVGHFQVDFLGVDEVVFERFERYNKMRSELGI